MSLTSQHPLTPVSPAANIRTHNLRFQHHTGCCVLHAHTQTHAHAHRAGWDSRVPIAKPLVLLCLEDPTPAYSCPLHQPNLSSSTILAGAGTDTASVAAALQMWVPVHPLTPAAAFTLRMYAPTCAHMQRTHTLKHKHSVTK